MEIKKNATAGNAAGLNPYTQVYQPLSFNFRKFQQINSYQDKMNLNEEDKNNLRL